METAETIAIHDNALGNTSNGDIINGDVNRISIMNLMKCLEIAIEEGEEEQAIVSVKELIKLKISVTVSEKKFNSDENLSPSSIELRGCSMETHCPRIVQPNETSPRGNRDQKCQNGTNSLEEIDGISELSSLELVLDEKVIMDPVITIEDDEINEVQDQLKRNHDENIIVFDDDDDDDTEIVNKKKFKIINKEKSNEYSQLKALEDCELVPNFEKFECPICLVEQEEMSGIVLRNCLHTFCRECMKQTVLMATDVEIKCPYRDDDYSCKLILRNSEIKALLNPTEYEQYLAKSINQAENCAGNEAFHCQTSNCSGWCVHDIDVISFLCPVCDKVNCLSCKAIHEAQTCDDYQISKDPHAQVERSRQRLDEMVKTGEAMYCPNCTIAITKIDGCDGFKCKCGTDICWATRQARWGPGGSGDTSGGCRCNVNGIRCHPNCHNCH